MRYTTYSETNLSWIESIPSHWKIVKNRQLLRETNGKTETGNEDLLMVSQYTGISRKERTGSGVGMRRAKSQIGYKLVNVGDIVMNIMLAWNGSTGASRYNGIVSPAYSVFCCREGVNPWYIHYLFRTPALTGFFKAYSTGIIESRLRLYPDVLLRLYSIVPPREEQDQIVRYLDWQVSKINKLIAAKKKQIALLRERELLLHNDLLTKGVNTSATLVYSGSNWMGSIPEHWVISRISRYFSIKKRIAGSEGYNVLSITQQGLKIRDVSVNEGQMAASYTGYQFVYPGDFAMNHMDLLTGYIDVSPFFGVTSPDYRVFVLNDTNNCYPLYYLYIFQLCYKRRIFYGHGKGAANKGRWRMPADNFKRFEIPLPPYDEQVKIIEAIKEQTSAIDKICIHWQEEIGTLHELRTRLIADVVTGQIDVRNIEIPDFEMVEETNDSELNENETDDNLDEGSEGKEYN